MFPPHVFVGLPEVLKEMEESQAQVPSHTHSRSPGIGHHPILSQHHLLPPLFPLPLRDRQMGSNPLEMFKKAMSGEIGNMEEDEGDEDKGSVTRKKKRN